MTLLARKPLLSFFLLAYGLSWAYWIPLALAGVRTAPGSTATHEPGLLGPALAAFIVTGLTQGRPGLAAISGRLVLVSRPTWRFLAYSLSPLNLSRARDRRVDRAGRPSARVEGLRGVFGIAATRTARSSAARAAA